MVPPTPCAGGKPAATPPRSEAIFSPAKRNSASPAWGGGHAAIERRSGRIVELADPPGPTAVSEYDGLRSDVLDLDVLLDLDAGRLDRISPPDDGIPKPHGLVVQSAGRNHLEPPAVGRSRRNDSVRKALEADRDRRSEVRRRGGEGNQKRDISQLPEDAAHAVSGAS